MVKSVLIHAVLVKKQTELLKKDNLKMMGLSIGRKIKN